MSSQQQSVVFYSPCDVNLQLILSLIMERSPGWIINKSRSKWILYAIETKDLNFLRILTQTIDPFITTCEYLQFAASVENNIPVIEYLLSLMHCPIDQLKVLISAVEKKAFENLKFFHEKMEFPIDDNYKLFSSAAGIKNNIEIMEYLKSHNCPTGHLTTSLSAAENGALNNLKWLLTNGFSMDDSDIFDAAMENGSLEVLKWLKENECPVVIKTIYHSQNCSIETIEWLIEQGFTINPKYIARDAAERGSLDKMKWLLKKKYSIKDSDIFKAAAEHGSLENLKFLLKNGCSINHPFIFFKAAKQGHFEVMKWLLKKKCPIDRSYIFKAAAQFGSIEQMK